MLKKNLTAEQRAAKANKKVGKALTVFTKAADELDAAAEHHWSNADDLILAAEAAEQAALALRTQAEDADAEGFRVAEHADRVRAFAQV